MNDPIVDITTKISINTQFIVGIASIYGLTLQLPEKDLILKDILILETIVQIIEFCWYYFIIQKLPQKEMAKSRYYDWIITTPIMLITIFSYLLYEEQLEKKPDEPPIRLLYIMRKYKKPITQILLSNFGMLLVGYLYEIGQISNDIAFISGFIFLINIFNIIYIKAGSKSKNGKKMFFIIFFLWSVYGIAFILPTGIKNSIFNITDLFSKNFFQVYITILSHNKKNMTK
jgi:hypothetical protein